MLYETMTELEYHLEEPTGASTTDISDSEIHVIQAWAQPSKRHMKLGLWYGRSHPANKSMTMTKVWSQPSMKTQVWSQPSIKESRM